MLNPALLLASVLAALLGVEAILRLAAHRILPGGEWVSTTSIFQGDPVLGARLRPGARRILVSGGAYTSRVRINSLGLRGPEPRRTKPGEGPRILVLGDSFMFGQGVPFENTFTKQIETLLPGSEAISAAVPGYSLGQSYLMYRVVGSGLEPDLVLLGFFMNDLEEMRALSVERDDRGVPVAYTPRPGMAPRLEGEPALFDRRQPQRMLEAWAGRSGAHFLDLLPHFEEHPIEETYFAYDLHWTERGHALAAEAVADHLRQAGLL